jgi:predicted DNA-binding transcriptional regulator AlpA
VKPTFDSNMPHIQIPTEPQPQQHSVEIATSLERFLGPMAGLAKRRQAEARLGVSSSTFGRILNGEYGDSIPVVRLSPRTIRFRISDLDAYIARHRTASTHECNQ